MDNINILLYDGSCNLCNATVNFIIRNDKNKLFSFVSLQSEKGMNLLTIRNIPVKNLETVVFIHNDEYFLRSTAILNVFKTLGGIGRLIYVLAIIPAPIRDWVYAIVSGYRHSLFGKRHTCTKSPSNRDS